MTVAPFNLHKLAPAFATGLALALLSTAQAHAASVTFYTTQTSFDASATGLTSFNYIAAPALTPGIYLQQSPVSSSTVSSNLAPGGIPAGITISNSNPALSPGLVFYTTGEIPGAGAALGTNYFGDALVLSFNPGVMAVGVDLFAAVSPEQSLAGTFSEEVFNGATLLGSTTVTDVAGQVVFTGVTSTSAITSIDLLYLTDDASTFANNIAFSPTAGSPISPPITLPPSDPGSPPSVPAASPVPEPSTWSLFAIGILLLLTYVRRPFWGGTRV